MPIFILKVVDSGKGKVNLVPDEIYICI